MSERFQCGDNTALVGYLYDECEHLERTMIAAHIAVCAACAAELATLESTRVQLASWSPPETELGFIISKAAPQPAAAVRDIAPPRTQGLAAAWFSRPLPAWAQVAAAAVIFAAGVWLGIARGGAPASAQPAQASAAPAAGAASVSAGDLAALEQRLRDEIAGIRASAVRAPASQASTAAPAASNPVEGQLMARVRALIEESEQRQQRELALRTTQIVRDFDSQRRLDLAEVQRGFGQIEGLTGAEVREQRQLLNYLMRVSQQAR